MTETEHQFPDPRAKFQGRYQTHETTSLPASDLPWLSPPAATQTRAKRAGPHGSPGRGDARSGCFHARNSFKGIENESAHSHLLLLAKERARSPHKSHSVSPPLSILNPLPGNSEGGGSEGQQVVGETRAATSRRSSLPGLSPPYHTCSS